MTKVTSQTLLKFLYELIDELISFNEYKGYDFLPIAEMVAPLYYSFSHNINQYNEFIGDLEKCSDSSPMVKEYEVKDDNTDITVLIKMIRVYNEFGDFYHPFNHEYELRFHKQYNKDNSGEYYTASLKKVSHIFSSIWDDEYEEYKIFINMLSDELKERKSSTL